MRNNDFSTSCTCRTHKDGTRISVVLASKRYMKTFNTLLVEISISLSNIYRSCELHFGGTIVHFVHLSALEQMNIVRQKIMQIDVPF